METKDDVREAVEMYPAVPRPVTVEVNEAVDRYPAEPRPVTVDVRFAILLIPKAVEKEEKEREVKLVVEINEEVKEAVERYPIDPNPMTVDVKLELLIPPPGPNAVEKEEKDNEIKLVVEISEEVKEVVERYPTVPRPATVEASCVPK